MLLPTEDVEVAARRLHHELEKTIRELNHELISASTGAITRSAFTNVAHMVACLRGRYLRCVLRHYYDCLHTRFGTIGT